MSDYYEIPPRAGGGDSTYSFPAMTALPSTVALWEFDETSGNFVDTVNSIALVPNPTGTNPDVYNVNLDQAANGGKLKNIVPCFAASGQVRMDSATGLSGTLGYTGSFTIECYAALLSRDNSCNFFYNKRVSGSESSFLTYYRTGYIQGRMYASDGTFVTAQTSVDFSTYHYTDGQVRHYALEYDATGNTLQVKIDGSSVASADATALSGKNIDLDGVILFGSTTAGVRAAGFQIYQLRISHAAVNGHG